MLRLHRLLTELTTTGERRPGSMSALYAGFGDGAAFKAMEYLQRYSTTSGQISDPVLAVHTSYDPIIPARYLSGYEALAVRAGRQGLASGEAPEAGEIRGGY